MSCSSCGTRLKPLQIDRDDDFLECPQCGAMFLGHDDRAFTGSGEYDEYVLTRLPDEQASVVRAVVHRGSRPVEEVASLADRWLALPDAAPDLVSRWVLKRDRELARALVPRMLDAMGRGGDSQVPRRFVEDFADHDAAFVKSELARKPSAAAFDGIRALCRRRLCSICRTGTSPAPPAGLTPFGVSPALDALECPECGLMGVWESGRGWSRLSEFESDSLRACLRREGEVPGRAQQSVLTSEPPRSLKVVLTHGLKRDRELVRQFLPLLMRELPLTEGPWLQDLLSEFAGAPGDAAAVLEAIARASRRYPQHDALAARCRAVLQQSRTLGLSLLREGRWAEAARVIEDTLRREGERAGDLHNLALARTRAGDPRGGLEAARKAVSLHLKLAGEYHPDTLESKLVVALALLETGDGAGAAEETRRAANAIRSQAGESHPFFADALLIEARRLAKRGDGGAAEALARRAMFIVKSEGVDGPALRHRESDAAAVEKLWRTARGARDFGRVVLWRMSIEHTLRRYQGETLDFAPSGDRPKEWYFFVPGGWAAGEAMYAARVVFADLSRALHEREPADANFLDATQAHAAPIDPRRTAEVDLAAAFRRKTWEPTAAFSLVSGVSSVPLLPDSFARALAALGAPDAPLLPLGVDAAVLVQARAHPGETLTKEIGF